MESHGLLVSCALRLVQRLRWRKYRVMSGSDSARSTARGRRYHAQLTNHRRLALPVELHILHEVVEGSRIFRGHAIVELNYQWAAPVVSGSRTLGSASMSASSPRSVMAGMRSQRPSSGKSSISPAETSSEMSTATASVRRPQPQLPTANCEAPRERSLPSRNGLARNPGRGGELHANVE